MGGRWVKYSVGSRKWVKQWYVSYDKWGVRVNLASRALWSIITHKSQIYYFRIWASLYWCLCSCMRLFALLVLKCILHCSRLCVCFFNVKFGGPRFHSQKHRHTIRVWKIPLQPFASNQNLTFTPLFGQDVGSGKRLAGRGQNIYIQCLVSVKLESQFFSLQKENLLVRKVQYLHTKFSFSMSIFVRESQIFSVTCGCVQKLNIYKIYLENVRFSSPVIEFFYSCSRVAANFFSIWKMASIIWCKTHIFSLGD